MKASLLVLLALAATAPALAQEQPPSDESLQQLFEATHLDRTLDAYFKQMDYSMQLGVREALKGQSPNPKQQEIIAEAQEKMRAAFRETLNWKDLSAKLREIYRKTFTQAEVDDMLKFYQSPTGRSIVDKQPAVMQQLGEAVQARMPAMVEKVKAIRQDTQEQLRAAAQN